MSTLPQTRITGPALLGPNLVGRTKTKRITYFLTHVNESPRDSAATYSLSPCSTVGWSSTFKSYHPLKSLNEIIFGCSLDMSDECRQGKKENAHSLSFLEKVVLRCQHSVLDLLHGVPAALVLEVDVGLVLEQRLQELQVSGILG